MALFQASYGTRRLVSINIARNPHASVSHGPQMNHCRHPRTAVIRRIRYLINLHSATQTGLLFAPYSALPRSVVSCIDKWWERWKPWCSHCRFLRLAKGSTMLPCNSHVHFMALTLTWHDLVLVLALALNIWCWPLLELLQHLLRVEPPFCSSIPLHSTSDNDIVIWVPSTLACDVWFGRCTVSFQRDGGRGSRVSVMCNRSGFAFLQKAYPGRETAERWLVDSSHTCAYDETKSWKSGLVDYLHRSWRLKRVQPYSSAKICCQIWNLLSIWRSL